MIGAEGAKTPAGSDGQMRPRRRQQRRGGSAPAPRKAKRLERKSTAWFKDYFFKEQFRIRATLYYFQKSNYEIDSTS
ncbi:hypothetical protein G3A_21360 [Bacillus sp. 17376]|uniref:Uncharacterized protein n=1 Tax=Mesobacillus boroniphilus JCM 21738 TaxID=1294265 RepID=W4RWU9_9BACI|nr:hypothetical protein G3A_21360 [Bacillus sp. 17376]GAE48353.1 hypothetical protein JCM21738_5467 [Mesobacillus boroniphilus JCM 21738]